MIDLWQEIYSTIKRNKMRTILTGFAVSWGIFMLIVLLGAGNGLIHAFDENSTQQASNSIRVWPGWTSKPFNGLKEGRRVQFNNKDLASTQKQFTDNVMNAGAIVQQGNTNLSFGQEYVNLTLLGIHPSFSTVEPGRTNVVKGRFINQLDIDRRRKIILLHQKTADILFGKSKKDPIGEFVTANGVAFQVVGIYKDRGDSGSRDAYIPFTTLQTIYNKGDKVNSILFMTKNLKTEEDSKDFEKRYRRAISVNQRFDPEDEGAMWIWNRFTQHLQQESASTVLRLAIWIIGVFTLLSGIVGVSNIMLITVKERTREFGIRKALGAKPSSILWLIIVESVVITTLFGYVGMVAGIGVTELASSYIGSQTMGDGMWTQTVFTDPTVDISIAIQATLALVIAGTLAGFFPARKAVSIRPIEALRAD